MNNQYIYIVLFIIIGFSSCNLFETEIVEDRSSFFKIYPKGNINYNAINGDYLVNTNEGFLMGASLTPKLNNRLSHKIRVSHDGALIDRKNIENTIDTYTKIIASKNGQDFYSLGSYDSSIEGTTAEIIKTSLESSTYSELRFGISLEALDFSVFSKNSQEYIIVLIRDNSEFDNIKTTLILLDTNLKTIWKREFSFDETALVGFSVIPNEDTGNFIVLGRDNDYQLFIMQINEDGNLTNTRFFEEFGFEPIHFPQNPSIKPIYKPTLIDIGSHYIVIETGRLYEKNDNSLPFSSIYKVDKDLNNITRLDTDTKFSAVNTVQKLDNEILINGFLEDSTFAIKKLDGEGNLVTWANGEDFVTFDMNIEKLENGNIFSSSPTLGTYNDFFVPGNIVKTTDGGYAMIGTYGIFNGDDFESVMTLFKFRSDGSY